MTSARAEVPFCVKTSDGLSIAGQKVDLVSPRALLVMCHGIGANRTEGGLFDEVVAAAAEEGIASARFDFRGHGKSDGRLVDLTLRGELADLTAVATAVVPDHSYVLVVGASFGTSAAVHFAAAHPRAVIGVILINPVTRYRETFTPRDFDHPRSTTAMSDDIVNPRVLARLPGSRAMITEALAAEFDADDTAALIPRLPRRALLIHGTDDTRVPVEHSAEIARSSANVDFVAIEGAEHGLAGYRGEAVRRIVSWASAVAHSTPICDRRATHRSM